MQDNKTITLTELKQKAEVEWKTYSELVEYQRELLDDGKTTQAKSVQKSINIVNNRWGMLDDLIEELENK